MHMLWLDLFRFDSYHQPNDPMGIPAPGGSLDVYQRLLMSMPGNIPTGLLGSALG